MTEPFLAPPTFAGGDDQPPRLTLVSRHEYRRPQVTQTRTASAHGNVVAPTPIAA
jgi:hypothetical protein